MNSIMPDKKASAHTVKSGFSGFFLWLVLLGSIVVLLTACGEVRSAPPDVCPQSVSAGKTELAANVPVSPTPYISSEYVPFASGEKRDFGEWSVLDSSHTSDGYVVLQYLQQTNLPLVCHVEGPATTYTYNITPREWTVLPLSDGDGKYNVVLYRNLSGSKFIPIMSVTFDAVLTDEFAPFIRPNQYVNYLIAPKTVQKAMELTADCKTDADRIRRIYDFIVAEISYDSGKAKNVSLEYLPVLDKVLEEKKGICFDYAALMAGMLRSQGVPCKLVVGFTGSKYHAWVNVRAEDAGLIEDSAYLPESSWARLDPTYAANALLAQNISRHVSNGSNYEGIYFY